MNAIVFHAPSETWLTSRSPRRQRLLMLSDNKLVQCSIWLLVDESKDALGMRLPASQTP
jgi:hypothetical protein